MNDQLYYRSYRFKKDTRCGGNLQYNVTIRLLYTVRHLSWGIQIYTNTCKLCKTKLQNSQKHASYVHVGTRKTVLRFYMAYIPRSTGIQKYTVCDITRVQYTFPMYFKFVWYVIIQNKLREIHLPTYYMQLRSAYCTMLMF